MSSSNPSPREDQETRGSSSISEESSSGGGFFFEMVKVFILAAVIIIPIRVFLFQPFFVQGSSMVPNFHDGEYLVVNEFGYKTTEVGVGGRPFFTVVPFRELKRQESIVFRSPEKRGQYLIKRVIGLPGETVSIRQSKVTIVNGAHPQGMVLDESEYLARSVMTTDMKPLVLGPDEYFVLGDNRTQSYDSRVFGPVPRDFIIGRVLFRAWPVGQAKWY